MRRPFDGLVEGPLSSLPVIESVIPQAVVDAPSPCRVNRAELLRRIDRGYAIVCTVHGLMCTSGHEPQIIVLLWFVALRMSALQVSFLITSASCSGDMGLAKNSIIPASAACATISSLFHPEHATIGI